MSAPAANPVGYAAEMRRIEAEIQEIGEDVLSRPGDALAITKYVHRRYQKAAIAQDLRELSRVEALIDRATGLLANPADLFVLKANLALKLHRLADARAALAANPVACQSREARLILADCDFQQGRYEAAKRGYCEALDQEVTWDGLARLAYFHARRGETEEAGRLYAQAEDELTAKEMRSFAWLRVQRGFLSFSLGRYAEAQADYMVAEAAYPGYPLVTEYVAELLAAKGRYVDALAKLDEIGTAIERPDLDQARGELCALMGERETAALWQKKALDAYLDSTRRDEVHYYHHLADYYCDVAECGSEAVRWARRDLELRENFATQSALALALYHAGAINDAVHWIDHALASGAVGAGLFHKAAIIHAAAGHEAFSESLRQRASALNPNIGAFHIHH